ncbi:MAG: hypothetical protein M1838_005643 [Thelocarpon superellum]|nr:MAG: hypothetical protein M1838_005643 [Thelocarpon superellum]
MERPSAGAGNVPALPESERFLAHGINRPGSPRTDFVARTYPSPSIRSASKLTPTTPHRAMHSVTDIGTSSSGLEAPPDSPTIPGRPPLHERSASAPGTADFDGVSRTTLGTPKPQNSRNTPWPVINAAATKRKSLSPINLSRLVIPRSGEDDGQDIWRLREEGEDSEEGTPPLPPPKSPWMTAGLSRYPTAPANMSYSPGPSTSSSSSKPPMTAPGDRSFPAWPVATPTRTQSPPGHQRQNSEAVAADRGRPTRRANDMVREQSVANSISTIASAELPAGIRPVDMRSHVSDTSTADVYRHAHDQALNFEVLQMKDVTSMTREMGRLDERCQYLRRTLNSLRMGRRGLHTRMVAYLKSPRVEKFSRESMLKQEEALGELDNSIDDWVGKLDQAESRRNRIQQKLMEHVAAALTLPPPSSGMETMERAPEASGASRRASPERRKLELNMTDAGPSELESAPVSSEHSTFKSASSNSKSSGHDLPGSGSVPEDDTPPRTPERPSTPQSQRNERRDVESIKIYAEPDVYPAYADADVYALLADVEQEISNMSEGCGDGSTEGAAEPWISSFAKTPMI